MIRKEKISSKITIGVALIIFVIAGIITAGCAPPSTYIVDVAYYPDLKKVPPEVPPPPIKVVVVPFKDTRIDQEAIGERIHISGKVDRFQSHPSPVGDAVTSALVSALKIQGYQTEVLAREIDPGSIQDPFTVVLSGTIKELWANARSRPGYTDIKSRVHFIVDIYRVDERKTYTVNAKSASESRVVLFSPSEMEETVNDAISEAINYLITNQWFK